MEVVLDCCAGLDVHKKTVAVCVRRSLKGGRVWKEVREYGTMTRDIWAMGDWMAQLGVTHFAMESTGVFWKPIYNLLEERFEILLCNAQHVKQVPGRKTDVKDCEWLAQLLQHGLLKGSFVPARDLRELRDLTRHRVQLVGEQGRVANRIHKTLEDANIKLGSVATDILGVSGREMLRAMIDGKSDPNELAELARQSLRGKIPQLRLALEGRLTGHHRFMLKILMEQLCDIEEIIREVDGRIDTLVKKENQEGAGEGEKPVPFDEALELLDTIPGVDRVAARSIVAEIGTDMRQFPSAGHLSSWTGICPGNNQSAGKRKSGTTTKGNHWLRRALTQAAWAAQRTKDSYFSAQFRRIAGRRGKKRALVAVAHSILVIAYHMLKNRKKYEELGADYFDRLNPERLTRYLVKRLESLGHKVSLEPAA